MATAMATATAEEAGEETYVDFKDELLQKLHEFRETNILCDTIIRAQGQDFPAHKCVLSAASPYFRGMFSNDLKEKESNLVELQDIKSSTLSDVLRYIYTGRTRIDSSNAKDLVMTADYLIIPRLKTRATLFLEGTLNASNCLAFESFASRYNCESLKKIAAAYKMEHFVDVTKSEDFRLLDVEKVKELICMDEINVAEEEEVYEAVMAWVKHDLPSRESLLLDLLKFVRLFSISKYRLRKILDEELVGHNGKVCQSSADCYNPLTNQWTEISGMSKVRRCAAAVAVGRNLFVVGGFGDMTMSTIEPSCEIFDPKANQWSLVPSLSIPRAASGIGSIGNAVYLFGGEDEEYHRNEVLCCFIGENKWYVISAIPSDYCSFLQASLLKLPKELISFNSEKDGKL